MAAGAATTPCIKALCIGVDDYQHLKPLENAVSDARRMQLELEISGCPSSFLKIPTRQAMTESLSSLSSDCSKTPPKLVLVFFAGHGIQLHNGETAMLPCDIARAEEAKDTRMTMMTVADLWKALDQVASGNSKPPPLLLIIDACRDPVQGLERTEPNLNNRNMRTTLSLILSCKRGQQASDESAFLKDLLDVELGMFAQNQKLTQAIDHAVRISRTREQQVITLCTEHIPDGLCIRSDPTVARDIGQMIEAGRQVAAASNRQQEPTGGPASGSRPQADQGMEMVAAYSVAPAQTGADMFRRSLLGVVKESLASLLDESPRWNVCSIFLLVFLRYEGTTYSTKAIRGYFDGLAKKMIGPKLIRRVGEFFANGNIRSEMLEQWVRETYGDIDQTKMVVAAIDFAVQQETTRSLADKPEEWRDEIDLWKMEVNLSDFFSSARNHSGITEEDALDKAEEYLKEKITDDQAATLAIHVLSRVVETGSCVAFLKTTRLGSVCLSVMLGRRVREALRGEREEHVFRTWVSSSGWVYGSHEHGELEERLDKEKVEELRATLDAVGRDGTSFMRWKELEREGALSVLPYQQVSPAAGGELKQIAVEATRAACGWISLVSADARQHRAAASSS
eukprot:114829-Hanusia_phi.AAC.1